MESKLCCIYEAPIGEKDAAEMVALLRAVADPVRLRLVSLIASSESGEICACDLPALLNRAQPTISHHLGNLVHAGILEREQRGKWAWFRLTDRLQRVASALGKL